MPPLGPRNRSRVLRGNRGAYRRRQQTIRHVATVARAVRHAAPAVVPVAVHYQHRVQRRRVRRAEQAVRQGARRVLKPRFTSEGPRHYRQAYRRHRRYATPGPYQTHLPRPAERAFRRWVARERIPFNPNDRRVDYDMRGYYVASRGAPHVLGQHFPDTFKTPYDTTFSHESKFATPNNPYVWIGDMLVNLKTGEVEYKPRRRYANGGG
jgi:hypothetical protein